MVAQVTNDLWRKDVKVTVEDVIWFGLVDNGVLSLCSTSNNLKCPISRRKQQSTWSREEWELHSGGLKVSSISGNRSWFLRKTHSVPGSAEPVICLPISFECLVYTGGELSYPAIHMTFDFSVN